MAQAAELAQRSGNGLTAGLRRLHGHPWQPDYSPLARQQFEAAITFIRNVEAHHAGEPTELVWLAQVGKSGNGKSHIVYFCVDTLTDIGIPARWLMFEDYMEELRQAVADSVNHQHPNESQAAIEQRIADEYCLALVDVRESDLTTPWNKGVLDRLISRRYNNGLPTLIDTNVTGSLLGSRVMSRLEDTARCQLILCTDDDRRPDAARWRK